MVCKQSPNDYIQFTTQVFCEYGGTQARTEYDEKPLNVPPMVSGYIVGIQPYHIMA